MFACKNKGKEQTLEVGAFRSTKAGLVFRKNSVSLQMSRGEQSKKNVFPILKELRSSLIIFIYPLIHPLPMEFGTLVQQSSDVSGMPGDG